MESNKALIDKEFVSTILNPNNYKYPYSLEYKLSVTKSLIMEMRESLGVIDLDAQNLSRIDIATDCNMVFQDNKKLLGLMHKCIRATKNGSAWINTIEETLDYSNFRFLDKPRLGIEFYNKNLESNGRSYYGTRLEIRFLRPRTKFINYEKYIKDVIKLWEGMPNKLSLVEDKMITLLKEKWQKELLKHKNPNFTAFVHKYEDHIYTRRILNEVYKEVGFKSKLASWLSDYKKKYTINFYKKTDLTIISKQIVRSLKKYMKN